MSTNNTDTALADFVDAVIDRYVEIVEANGTVEDVLGGLDSPETSPEIVDQLLATAQDAVTAGTVDTTGVNAGDLYAAFRNALHVLADRLLALDWEDRLLGEFYAATPFYPGGIEVAGLDLYPGGIEVAGPDSYYVIVTEDPTGEHPHGYLLGFYDRRDDHSEAIEYISITSYSGLLHNLGMILRRNPEGTDWSAWSIQRISDDGRDVAVEVRP